MTSLLIFYWIFSALFLCGGISQTQEENKWQMYFTSFLTGGILFPMILGMHLYNSLGKNNK